MQQSIFVGHLVSFLVSGQRRSISQLIVTLCLSDDTKDTSPTSCQGSVPLDVYVEMNSVTTGPFLTGFNFNISMDKWSYPL